MPRRPCYGGILYKSGSTNTDPIQYLVVKGRCSGIWSFPKGHSHKEEEPLICAKREIEEETGIHLEKDPIHHCRLKGAVYYIFDGNDLEEENLIPHDTFEIEETRWVTREEMQELNGNGGIREFLKRKNPVRAL